MLSTWQFGSLRMFGYDVIVADPPWEFELYNQSTGAGKAASAHYDTMPIDEIKAFRVGELARGDCLLLLWCTGWGIAQGIAGEVARAWGFRPITEIVWRKTTPKGKVSFGPGYRVRTRHEPILLATIGEPKHKPFHSLYDGVRRQHSRKPDEFYWVVAKATPSANRCDLFARGPHDGFDRWGREADKFNEGATDEQSTKRRPPASTEPPRRAGALGVDLSEERRLI